MPGWALPTELMDEVWQQSMDELLELGPTLIEALLGPTGSAFGDRDLTRGERILRFLDDAHTGALDVLRIQSPAVFAGYEAEFKADIAQSPLVGAA